MTTFSILPEFEKLMILSTVERSYDSEDWKEIKDGLNDGSICAYCLMPKKECTCHLTDDDNDDIF